MKKRVFYSELAYLLGLLILALGTALMERADFGVSMVVAPAYILHLALSPRFPFFTFGMAEYTLQAALLLLTLLLLRRAKWSYLFSFITAVIYGFMLDGAMALIALIPPIGLAGSLLFFLMGMVFCAMGVSLLFHTYISPEAYELLVKEVSQAFHWDIHRFKTLYDCLSCFISVILSFAVFGLWRLEGVKGGTLFCALVNGSLIGLCTRFMESRWTFQDRFPLRAYF
ncbi:MAG: hypothetical protein IJ461_08845 [Clostridia bacterium]|nr:hypothetical protein [Clostridia bacterium]